VDTGNTFTGSKAPFGAEINNGRNCFFCEHSWSSQEKLYFFFPPRLKTFLDSVKKKKKVLFGDRKDEDRKEIVSC
jgi:hypothetical protein